MLEQPLLPTPTLPGPTWIKRWIARGGLLHPYARNARKRDYLALQWWQWGLTPRARRRADLFRDALWKGHAFADALRFAHDDA